MPRVTRSSNRTDEDHRPLSRESKKTLDNRRAAQKFRQKQKFLIENYYKLAKINLHEVIKMNHAMVSMLSSNGKQAEIKFECIETPRCLEECCIQNYVDKLAERKLPPPYAASAIESKIEVYDYPQSHNSTMGGSASEPYSSSHLSINCDQYYVMDSDGYCPNSNASYYSDSSSHSLVGVDSAPNSIPPIHDIYANESPKRPNDMQLPDKSIADNYLNPLNSAMSCTTITGMITPTLNLTESRMDNHNKPEDNGQHNVFSTISKNTYNNL
ncbi:hypothetical protein WR25_08498 [Diploscapter pachys]|uniref:BZIP domain-containing protein n=1 Tax=Diploscapter pachys TaxID=2018661 RepID=A0A2A2LFA7_9BILA|nr:hypothetical protein WR25_08498 [Diploscapter pachys]